MKPYLTPQYEFVLISADDVIATSVGNVSMDESDSFWNIYGA